MVEVCLETLLHLSQYNTKGGHIIHNDHTMIGHNAILSYNWTDAVSGLTQSKNPIQNKHKPTITQSTSFIFFNNNPVKLN